VEGLTTPVEGVVAAPYIRLSLELLDELRHSWSRRLQAHAYVSRHATRVILDDAQQSVLTHRQS
jgi:hypothetical protein